MAERDRTMHERFMHLRTSTAMFPLQKTLKNLALAGGLLAGTSLSSLAVHEREGGEWPWNLKLHGYHDAEVAEALGTGWFLNVGPTGIRARITRDLPKYFTVKYVFRNSPAAGKVEIGDVIIGANGKRMNVDHLFGRGTRGAFQGPMVEMSKLIEDSQAEDGKLELIVWPGGERSNEKTVTVEIEPLGRFSPTWPYDCERSDNLMLELCEFLYQEYRREGRFGRPHTHSAAVLALLGSNERKYERLAMEIIRGLADKRYDPLNGVGFQAWNWGHEGIMMGEYYLMTGDRRMRPAIQSLVDCLIDAQTPQSGGYSHRPGPYIMRRVAAGGPSGYGAMSLPGGLAMTAMSLFKVAGLDYGKEAHDWIFQAYLRSVNDSGNIGYGFNALQHAVVTLTGPDAETTNSPRGIGFEIESGMKDMGPYEINWPTKEDPRYRPTNWLERERETNRVFDFGGAKRKIVRAEVMDPPRRPYQHDGGQVHHLARTGSGALGASIGAAGDRSWQILADHLAKSCAMSPENLLDGHASTHMHVIWGGLGAALASERDFRNFMDGIKWWFIMAHTHNGGFVVMPGRDYASTDHVYGTRVFPSGCAAIILAVKEKRLQITGAPRIGEDGVTLTGRRARFLAPDKEDMLNDYLRLTLAEMTLAEELRPLEMEFSKARSKVVFNGVEDDWKLRFGAPDGGPSATFSFDDITLEDRTMLARLAAALRQNDPEVQAMAGLFMEMEGDVDTADQYYERAGEEFAPVLEAVFE